MSFRNFISVAGGWIIPIAVLGVGATSAFMIYGKFKSGNLSIGGQALKAEIEQNQEKVTSLQKQLKMLKKRLIEHKELEEKARSLAAMEAELKELRAANAAAKGRLLSINDGLNETLEMFSDYRQRYRNHIRAQAVGIKMDKLTTLGGDTYNQVEIKAVGALGMNITHQDGSCRIPFKELPLDMQRLYQFDDEEAEALQKIEAERRRKRQLALEASLKAEDDKQPQEIDPEVAKRKREELDLASENLKTAIRSIKTRIKQTESKLREEESKKVSKAPQYRLELQRLNQALEENETRLRDLKAIR